MTHIPKAFIFDLDGVITDTAEFHFLAWKQLAESLGIKIDRAFNEGLKGVSRMESLERILALDPILAQLPLEKKEKLATEKNEHYKKLIGTINAGNTLQGIEKLLKNIKQQNIKMAIGSASKNAQFVLEKLGLTHYFDHIVDVAKVKYGKPHPEIFTTAADYIDIPYVDCIGIEDAAAGVEAINRAKMFSVGVGSKDHLAAAHYTVESTAELNFNEILKQYANWRK